MNIIYKYPIPLMPSFRLELPDGAYFLGAQVQESKVNGAGIMAWYMVDNGAPLKPHQFRIYGTGHEITEPLDNLLRLATVQMQGYVWHLFEFIEWGV